MRHILVGAVYFMCYVVGILLILFAVYNMKPFEFISLVIGLSLVVAGFAFLLSSRRK